MKYKKEIIAVLDPMCSWCWGFEPVLEKIRMNLPSDTKLSMLLGGLRSKGDQAWNTEFKNYLREHWQRVQASTGQEFNTAILGLEHFEYDTEPPCRAAVAVRELDEAKLFTFFQALQQAFYVDARDITQSDVLADIAEKEGIDREKFLELFADEKMRDKTKADAYKARSMGANAFPSLVFIDEEGHLCVMKGYRSFEQIKRFLD